jgi:hypothetical protein
VPSIMPSNTRTQPAAGRRGDLHRDGGDPRVRTAMAGRPALDARSSSSSGSPTPYVYRTQGRRPRSNHRDYRPQPRQGTDRRSRIGHARVHRRPQQGNRHRLQREHHAQNYGTALTKQQLDAVVNCIYHSTNTKTKAKAKRASRRHPPPPSSTHAKRSAPCPSTRS